MNPHQRQLLEEHLKSLPKAEQDRLYRRAAELRREEQKHRKAEHKDFEDLDAPRPNSARRGADPVRLYVLKILAREMAGTSPERERGATGEVHGTDESAAARRSRSGLVPTTGLAVEVGKRRCVVRPDGAPGDGSGDIECRLPAHLAGRQQDALCTGDRVTFTTPDDDRRQRAMVEHVLPRRTVLARRDPATRRRQAVAANVDAVVIVVSVVSPPLHPRLIDRYLLAVEDSWVAGHTGVHADDPDPAAAIIAVNKIDLLDDAPPAERAAELARLEPYRAVGIPVVECCAADGRGMDELRALLAGKTVVFVGHSGVGKSSLTNALDPRLGIRVGGVGHAANRGRHTTTSAQLHEVHPSEPRASARAVRDEGARSGWAGSPPLRDSEGRPSPAGTADAATPHPGPLPTGEREGSFRVIDTPGIRFFALDDLSPAELRDSMPELRRLRQGCKFNDCTHTHEPGCAVKAAAEAGTLHPARYETYLRLLEEIEQGPKGPPALRIRPLPDEPELRG